MGSVFGKREVGGLYSQGNGLVGERGGGLQEDTYQCVENLQGERGKFLQWRLDEDLLEDYIAN